MSRRTQSVTAADANRRFSELLGGVRDGRSFVITSHGKPVARMLPFDRDAAASTGARRALLERLKSEAVVDAGHWTRESLYER